MKHKVNCVLVTKAEVIWNGEGTVVEVSQRSRHSTDENDDRVFRNDEGTG